MNSKGVTNVRVRIIVTHNGKVLVQYRKKGKFYHYIGGHLEYGETIKAACIREVKEECGEDINFSFKKILYIRDFLDLENNDHATELFILGSIDKTDGLEGKKDPEHPDGSVWTTWLDMDNLPDNLLPNTLSKKLVKEYKKGFPDQGEYVGEVK